MVPGYVGDKDSEMARADEGAHVVGTGGARARAAQGFPRPEVRHRGTRETPSATGAGIAS